MNTINKGALMKKVSRKTKKVLIKSMVNPFIYVNVYDEAIKQDPVKALSMKIREAEYIAEQYLSINNLFYNEQYMEVVISDLLGHEYNNHTQDPDAFNQDGEWVEYKSINISGCEQSDIRNKSFQFHWISANKIENYRKLKDIYFIVRHNSKPLEIYKLDASVILPDLETAFNKAEIERIKLDKKKNINAHKSYSLEAVKKLGAELIYVR